MLISKVFNFSSYIVMKHFNIKRIKFWEITINENCIICEKMDFETIDHLKKNTKGIMNELKDPDSICLFERTNVSISIHRQKDKK